MGIKYEEAYCTVEENDFSLDEVAYIFGTDSIRYARSFDKHMVCPSCRKVPLSFVNAGHPYFRGYPNIDHEEGCFYTKDELQPEEVSNLLNNPAGENVVKHQMERLLIRFLRSGEIKVNSEDVDRPVSDVEDGSKGRKRWQSNKVIPQKQLNAPFADGDYGVEKIFYGKVHIEWEAVQSSDRMKLLIWGIATNRLICKLYVTQGVYQHLRSGCKKELEFDAFVTFFASLTKRTDDSSWCRGTLRKSTLISISRIANTKK